MLKEKSLGRSGAVQLAFAKSGYLSQPDRSYSVLTLPDDCLTTAHLVVIYNLKATRNLTIHVLFFEWQYSLNFRNLFYTNSSFCSLMNCNRLCFRYSKRKVIYSEKTTRFREISTFLCSASQK